MQIKLMYVSEQLLFTTDLLYTSSIYTIYIYIDFYVQILSTGIKLKFNISKKNIFPTRNILE